MLQHKLKEAHSVIASGLGRKIDIVVPVSGGKDSQACLLLAKATGKSVLGLFCDTQFEHPYTYKHIERIKELYGVDIVYVTGGSVKDKIIKYNRFPLGGSKFCTNELKLLQSKLVYDKLSLLGEFEVWIGVRQGESNARRVRYSNRVSDELYLPEEINVKMFPKYLSNRGVRFRFPILEWSDDEVYALIRPNENPLYRMGFTRVGCFPCLAAGDSTKVKAFEFDETGRKHYTIVRELEEFTGQSAFSSPQGRNYSIEENCISFEDDDDNPGCAFCSM